MPRTKVTETTVYTWDELSPAAKDRAREEHSRFLWEAGWIQEDLERIWRYELEEAGWTDLEDLSYSLYSPGGEPMWRGDVDFEFEGRTYHLTVRKRPLGGSSYAWDVGVVDPDDPELDAVYGTPEWDAAVARVEAVERAAKDMLRALSSKLLAAFREEDDYRVSDEVMAEDCAANGYEFTEDGTLA